MNEDQTNRTDLLDTTDCLEAIGVFRGWKNFLFVIAICCLLLLQVFFWLVNTGHVKADNDTNIATSAVVAKDTEQISEAAKQVAKDPNQPVKAVPQQPAKAEPQKPQQEETISLFSIKFEQLAWLIRFFNFVLILTAALYCLTMLFSLKVSLIGRLGGINHISRALFLSLLFLVFLLPWQIFFDGVVAGAIFTPAELLSRCAAVKEAGIFGHIFHYLRFTGYWLLVMLLLVLSQIRSARSAKLILRRLEVV